LHAQEPDRADVAEELSVALYQLANAADDEGTLEVAQQEIIDVLTSFEQAATMTAKATAVLGWARQQGTST
jgi:hypothetical protein